MWLLVDLKVFGFEIEVAVDVMKSSGREAREQYLSTFAVMALFAAKSIYATRTSCLVKKQRARQRP